MGKEFYIDDDECISCGSCAEICPGCFQYEEGMIAARVIHFDCDIKLIEEAMDTCPVGCIYWAKGE
ncbi:MAG: ferredoxin [Desulfobulbaceae bacterium]|nr:ferredoxin [Desulfobulbaceae bacterium]